MSRRVRGIFRVVGLTMAVALVAVIALCIALIVDLNLTQRPPDVAGIARSRPVADADHFAASATSAALKALAPAGASWLAPGPTAVSDRCASFEAGEFVTSWTPTTCVRAVTAYFFFNGSFLKHMQAWDTGLRAAGWSADGYPLSQPLSYYAEYGDRHVPNEPGQTYLATSLPPSGPYTRAPGGSRASGQSVGLMFRWAERPQATPSFENIGEAPIPGPAVAVAWIKKATLSPDAVESAAFSRYQYVAVATLTAQYYDSAVPALRPATHPAVEGACMSGSDTCN